MPPKPPAKSTPSTVSATPIPVPATITITADPRLPIGELTAALMPMDLPSVSGGQPAIPATGVCMFCVPDKGWTLVELKLLMTSSGPELVSWENVGEEPYLPKTHVDNMLRRFCAYHYLYPQGG